MDNLAIILAGVFLILLILLIVFSGKARKMITQTGKKGFLKTRFFVKNKALKEGELMEKLAKGEEHWWKEKERGNLLGLFDADGIKETKLSYINLLGKVIEGHEIRKTRKVKMKEKEENVFLKVEGIVQKLKEEETKVEELTEKEAKDIFSRLREAVEKAR